MTAFRAISERCSFVSLAARALPPALPLGLRTEIRSSAEREAYVLLEKLRVNARENVALLDLEPEIQIGAGEPMGNREVR